MAYSDGRYYGVNSPQPNDWFVEGNDVNPKSNFNSVTILKCVMEMCMLGASHDETGTYTLQNAGVFVSIQQTGNVKFTGKYSTVANKGDGSGLTKTLAGYAYSQFYENTEIKEMIKNEIDLELPKFDEFKMLYKYNYENVHPVTYWVEGFSVKNLFCSTHGLEDYLKQNLALFLSGVYGHYFDYVLRFFDCGKDTSVIDDEAHNFKYAFNSYSVSQHIGSPLACYCKDYKEIPEKNMLLGYNLSNMSKCISLGIFSISDNTFYNTKYKPTTKYIGLFPIVYQNVDLTCNIKCWRSFRKLLKTFNTRQQRDLVMEQLNLYGRKCFTILDPYGMFLHFHDETKGLDPIN